LPSSPFGQNFNENFGGEKNLQILKPWQDFWRSHAPPGAAGVSEKEAYFRILDIARLNELCLASIFD
jgi:hypothetical protein